MYVQHHEVAEVVHPYIVHRCRQSVDFSLQCAWLLEAYSPPASSEGLNKKNRSHGSKLKNLILSGELVPKNNNDNKKETIKTAKQEQQHNTHHKRTHIRSRSDASALISTSNRAYPGSSRHFKQMLNINGGGPGGLPPPNHLLELGTQIPLRKLTLGDLTSGRAFDNGCICFDAYKVEINDLRGRSTYCKLMFQRYLMIFSGFFKSCNSRVDYVNQGPRRTVVR